MGSGCIFGLPSLAPPDLLNATSHNPDDTSNKRRMSWSGHHLGLMPEGEWENQPFMVRQAHHERNGLFSPPFEKGDIGGFKSLKV